MIDLKNIPPVTKNLIIINVIMYLAQVTFEAMNFNFALHFYLSDYFKPYQLITHMFMHGSMSHIFFNMFGVYMFGSALEHRLGGKRFLIFYLLTGFGAVILHFASMYWEGYTDISNIEQLKEIGKITSTQASNAYLNLFSITLGASGALFGLLAGFAMLNPNQHLYLMFIPVPIKAKYFVLFYAAIELYSGMKGSPTDNIAHFAHLGGALFGYLLIKQWKKKYII